MKQFMKLMWNMNKAQLSNTAIVVIITIIIILLGFALVGTRVSWIRELLGI